MDFHHSAQTGQNGMDNEGNLLSLKTWIWDVKNQHEMENNTESFIYSYIVKLYIELYIGTI